MKKKSSSGSDLAGDGILTRTKTRIGRADAGLLEPDVRFELGESVISVVGSIEIASDIFTVWETLTSYKEAPLYWANMVSCRLVGEQRGTKFVQQVVKASDHVTFKYTVSLQEAKPFLIEWQRYSGSLETIKGSWRLTPTDSGTIATYKVHLDGGPLLPSWLLSSQIKGYLPQTLKSLKALIEKNNRTKPMSKSLKLLFFAILVTMLSVTSWAATQESILKIPPAVTGDPWFIATLFDAYFAFLVIFLFVCYREKSFLRKAIWGIAFAALGNIAISVYMLIALRKLKPGSGIDEFFTREN